MTAFTLVSCGSAQYLTGNYKTNYSTTTDTPYDVVWDNVIDYFAENGIPIATLEKNSGLIVATKVKCSATVERNGCPANPSAFAVIPDYKTTFTRNKPDEANLFSVGTFNVRVRESDGKVNISINFYDIEVFEYSRTLGIEQVISFGPGASTGAFETELIDRFK